MSDSVDISTSVVEVKKERPKLVRRKVGRPLKKDIEAKKKGNRGKVGRPAGDAARINEFKARLLGTSGDKIIETLIAKALNPDDKDNMAALKLCVDRILPLSVFDAAKNSGSTPQISINITSLAQPEVTTDVVDMGAVEEEDDNA